MLQDVLHELGCVSLFGENTWRFQVRAGVLLMTFSLSVADHVLLGPLLHLGDEEIEVSEALFEDPIHQLVIHGFISVHQEISKGRHVLKCGQVLRGEDPVLGQDQKQVAISRRLPPSME
jgi:hypothetical protein